MQLFAPSLCLYLFKSRQKECVFGVHVCVFVGEGYWLGWNSPVMSRFYRGRDRKAEKPKRADDLVGFYNNNPGLDERRDGEDKEEETGGISASASSSS